MIQGYQAEIENACGTNESCADQMWDQRYQQHSNWHALIQGVSPCTSYPGGCAQQQDDLETNGYILAYIYGVLNG
jgi:hypothetical protein